MTKKKKASPPPEPTREEQIAAVKRDFLVYINPETIAPPERQFDVGQTVVLGGWQKSVIIEKFLDNRAYLLDCETIENRHGQLVRNTAIRATWWFDLRASKPQGEAEFFEPYRPGQANQTPLQSIIFLYEKDGIVADPSYQRGYIWSDFDREQLLTSVFERLEIGTFLFVRKHGFRHKESEGSITYNTLHGQTITIPKYKDYTLTVVDGQQRLTTLINFYLDKFTYKGKFFSQLTGMDQHYFEDFTVQHRIIEEEHITRKEILRMFLQANRGVPQTREHLEKVQKMYEQEK